MCEKPFVMSLGYLSSSTKTSDDNNLHTLWYFYDFNNDFIRLIFNFDNLLNVDLDLRIT